MSRKMCIVFFLFCFDYLVSAHGSRLHMTCLCVLFVCGCGVWCVLGEIGLLGRFRFHRASHPCDRLFLTITRYHSYCREKHIAWKKKPIPFLAGNFALCLSLSLSVCVCIASIWGFPVCRLLCCLVPLTSSFFFLFSGGVVVVSSSSPYARCLLRRTRSLEQHKN